MLLQVTHVSKSYPGLPVLHDVSLTADEGEIVCLLGPSGCGKSTLLRIVAGLETPDSGQVAFAGVNLAGVPAHRRGFGLMFQDYALFPHRDVAANVAFGLRMQGRPPAETAARVREMLALVNLAGYERRRVVALSGGEQQRVALARSLAPRPRLLMLDEPLAALDRSLAEQLMNELRVILKGVGVTSLYVTHDQEEAFAVADRVLIMAARVEAGLGGWIEQEGAPQEVYRRPATGYVARFLGFRNLLEGRVLGEQRDAGELGGTRRDAGELGGTRRDAGELGGTQGNSPVLPHSHTPTLPHSHTPTLPHSHTPTLPHSHTPTLPHSHTPTLSYIIVDTPLGRLAAGNLVAGCAPGDRVTVLIRPEAAEVRPAGALGPNVVMGRLVSCSFRGSYHLLRTAHAGDIELTCEVAATDADLPPVGEPLALWLDPAAITLLPG